MCEVFVGEVFVGEVSVGQVFHPPSHPVSIYAHPMLLI